MNRPDPVSTLGESELHPTVPLRSTTPQYAGTTRQPETALEEENYPDAVEHWAELLPEEFISFLGEQDLLNMDIESLLEKFENDSGEISPRQARTTQGITEGIERLEKIQKVAMLYISPDNQAVEEVIAELHLPPKFRVKFLELLKQKGVQTLLDIYIIGKEALNSGNFPEDVMLAEDEICYLYDRVTLLYLSENALLLAKSEEDEGGDFDPVPVIHNHHHRHGMGLKMTSAICAAVLGILAQADYIKFNPKKMKKDISDAVHYVIGLSEKTSAPAEPIIAPDTQNPGVEK